MNFWVGLIQERGLTQGSLCKVCHFAQSLTNKRHNFRNLLNLKVTKRPFHFYIMTMKVTFASGHKRPFHFYITIIKATSASASLSTIKGSNTVQQLFRESFLEIRYHCAIIRHVNSGGRGGRHAPNVWKMLLELENHSLHLEFVCSMRTHF